MASDSKPKKTGRFRSRFQRLFSSSSGARDGRSGEPVARDLQALVPNPSSPEALSASSRAGESHVSAMGTERENTRAGAEGMPFSTGLSASTSILPTSRIDSAQSTTGWESPERGNRREPGENVYSPMGPSAFTSTFSKAHHFNVGGSININSPHHHTDGWKILLENIASNAFYDSGARFDSPKCDEDTRVEVIGELMDWMNDRENPQRLLCMTGAAGAGKSALQQTIAERCADAGILGVAFFFSSQDPTRYNLSRIVPTIAFQIGQHDPTLKDCITKAIEKDPNIFTKTIRIQMDTLVVCPFKQLCENGDLDRGSFPHAVLIDGLDECSGEEQQEDLLCTIKNCLLDNDLPFRVFIASRPEWAIRSALDPESHGYLHPIAYHIQLSDKYDATEDIRRFLWRRLQAIGGRSRDPRARSRSWPTVEDIEKLVRAASGQFVYAATIVKYVSERRSFPVERLQTVINWSPEGGTFGRPFEALDILYAGILTAAKESYEAVDTNQGRNFLLLFRAHQINSDRRIGNGWYPHYFDDILNLERGTHEVLVSDLRSLVAFDLWGNGKHADIHFYHQSFSEFLDSETRAKNLFIAEIQVKEYVSEVTLERINRLPLEPRNTSATSSFTFKAYALVALTLYSDRGQTLSDQQILALAQNDEWRKFDSLIPHSRLYNDAVKFVQMISVFLRRLKDELKEPELADALQPYYDKWRKDIEAHGMFWSPPPDDEETEEGEDSDSSFY